MITPKELLSKTEKLFFKIASASFKDENIFPYTIPSNKQVTGSNYSDWKGDLIPLYQQSKTVKTKGYSVDWKEKIINGSKQSVPAKIYFDTLDDYLFFTGKAKTYQNIVGSRRLILAEFPLLEEWVDDNLPTLLNNFEIWEDIIKVCKYFSTHPPPHPYYARELPIEVHSKFIEQNVTLLKKLLDLLLPAEWKKLSENDIAGRYFLRKVNVYTQIRILDDDLKPHLGYDECTLTLEDAAWLKWLPEKVFIIENQICYLTFPKVKNSVAIFGEGFKSRMSKHIPWLNKTKLYCWFDLDAAGFEMLNMIRQHYPDASSFLMDDDTYRKHSQFAVENRNRRKELPYLLPTEQRLYEFLQSNNKRLEQERITQQFVNDHLV